MVKIDTLFQTKTAKNALPIISLAAYASETNESI